MNQTFNPKTKYKLSFYYKGVKLFFTATNIVLNGRVISFKDKFGNHLIYELDENSELAANEIKGE